MDKFESMRAFVAVVEAGGFAAASRNLGLSRSAVNKLVLNLEDALAVQLLQRTTRQVTPTPTGIAFYDRCVAILADLAEAELAVSQLQTEPKGQLRINAPMTFGTRCLSPAIAQFLQQYPELQVELSLSDRFIDPIDEGFDVTIRIAKPPQSASLIVQEVFPAPVILCAAPRYLATQGIPTNLNELPQHNCLAYGHIATDKYWILTDPDSKEHRIVIRGAICANNGEVLRDAAVQGLGITLLPQFIIHEDIKQGRLQQILPEFVGLPISACVLYPVNRHLSTKVRLFVDFLVNSLQDTALAE